MTTSEVIGVVQAIIYLGGLAGAIYWARTWFRALKGAVQAQKTTIDAQQAIIEGMANFMNIADAPKMAERYEAYKKTVDLEKDAILKQFENQFQEEKKTLLQSTIELKEGYEKLEARHKQVVPLYAEAMLKLVVHYQLNPLEWEAQKPTTSAQLAENIQSLIELLPPPPPRPKTPAEIFFAAGVEHSLAQQALKITKGKPK